MHFKNKVQAAFQLYLITLVCVQAVFLNTSRFTGQAAQVVQFRTAHITAAFHFDFLRVVSTTGMYAQCTFAVR